MTNYTTILDTYTLEDLVELNDLTMEDILKFLVEEEFIVLPEITPLEFND